MNFNHFYFSDKKIVLPYNFVIISSDNKSEILYLFSLLNSSLQKTIIDKNFRLEQEDKLSILLGIKLIKSQIRVPRITEDNQPIKDEIIRRTEKMLGLEDKTLSDFVDFSMVIMQKFDNVSVEDNSLILEKDSKKIRLPIKDNKHIVRKTLEEKYPQNELGLNKQAISISDLKNLLIIDSERQNHIKNYIDDLVFALYFNVPLKNTELNDTNSVKTVCAKNQYNKLVTFSVGNNHTKLLD